ncbi:MAG: OmpH family outer membrane protein [Flavisolibacter sp.]|jgi:outer membrane protein|nr:OmpH family outer membrane protein [Flavisolibacter sp.]
MKNASLILNIVLVVAVAVLFYLHFSSGKKAETTKVVSSTGTASVPAGDFRIAYFEMDSINASFAMVKDVKTELGKEEERINNELTRLQKTYNEKITQYQGQSQSMSQVESEKANRDVLQLQERIRSTKQEMDQKFQDLYMRKMQDVKMKVEDYLKEYNKSKGYTYILAYEPGFIFYRDSTYNITGDLLKGLNGLYKKK